VPKDPSFSVETDRLRTARSPGLGERDAVKFLLGAKLVPLADHRFQSTVLCSLLGKATQFPRRYFSLRRHGRPSVLIIVRKALHLDLGGDSGIR
jgi:hypothetical protein